MKDVILKELIKRWGHEAEPTMASDVPACPAPSNEEQRAGLRVAAAKRQARRETLRECADTLHMLVGVLGDGPEARRTVRP